MIEPILDAAALETLVSAAVAAPSIHNTQPWRFRLDADTRTVEVHAAPERALELIDPDGRALHISVGAAVFNLRVAASHLGWEPVERLLPHPPDPGLLASVRLAGPVRTIRTQQRDLYAAIWNRHSSRMPFTERRLPDQVVQEIREAAQAEGAELHLPEEAETHRLLTLAAEAERRTTGDRARQEETRAWIKDPGEAPYGIPTTALGPLDFNARMPMREFSAHRPPSVPFEPHPQVGVLATRGDGQADWLRAGQALEHVLLVLTAHGLRASLLYQPLEWADDRWLLRDPRLGICHPQMLLRMGYGPEGPATPRCEAEDVLVEPAASGRHAPRPGPGPTGPIAAGRQAGKLDEQPPAPPYPGHLRDERPTP